MGGFWQIDHLPKAESGLKRFLKPFKGKNKEKYAYFYFSILEGLREQGLHPSADPEPLPGNISLPTEVELWKIRVDVPGLRGAISKLRILYLRYVLEERVLIISVYTHKEFEKRPPDHILAKLIKGELK